MSEKTPVSNFLNGLSKKVRETEQKINKPKSKRNWDSESSNNQPKSFSEFDINEPLEKMNKKLGSFSSTVSSKFADAVSHLNERVNANDSTAETSSEVKDEANVDNSSENTDDDSLVHVKLEDGTEGYTLRKFADRYAKSQEAKKNESNESDEKIDNRWKKVTMPDGSVGYTSAVNEANGDSADKDEAKSSDSEKLSNVYDIFGKKNSSETKYVNDSGNLKGDGPEPSKVSSNYDFLSGLGDKWNKHVVNDENTEKMTHLMDSFHNGLNQLTEKYNNVLDNSDYGSKNVREWFGTGNEENSEPTLISGKSIASGSEMISVLTDRQRLAKPAFGVVVDEDNENNALMMAIIAARNEQYDFLNLDLANSAVNDLSDQKANRAFDKVQEFMSENTIGLVTVDAREISNDNARMIVEYLYHESQNNGWLVLVLTSNVEQLVSGKDTFAKKFKNSAIIEY